MRSKKEMRRRWKVYRVIDFKKGKNTFNPWCKHKLALTLRETISNVIPKMKTRVSFFPRNLIPRNLPKEIRRQRYTRTS